MGYSPPSPFASQDVPTLSPSPALFGLPVPEHVPQQQQVRLHHCGAACACRGTMQPQGIPISGLVRNPQLRPIFEV